MKYKQRVWIMYNTVFSLSYLTVKELSTEEHFIIWTAKLNQHIYFKGILISKFKSKDLLLWKRDSSFVSTEDENLCFPSRLMWFDGPRPLKGHHEHPKIILPNKKQEAVLEGTIFKFPNIVYKCLVTFRGGYAIDICIGMDLGLLIQI